VGLFSFSVSYIQTLTPDAFERDRIIYLCFFVEIFGLF